MADAPNYLMASLALKAWGPQLLGSLGDALSGRNVSTQQLFDTLDGGFRSILDDVIRWVKTDRLEDLHLKLDKAGRAALKNASLDDAIRMIEASLCNPDTRVIEFLLHKNSPYILLCASVSPKLPALICKDRNPRAVAVLLQHQSNTNTASKTVSSCNFITRLLELDAPTTSVTDRRNFKWIFFQQLTLGGIDRKMLERYTPKMSATHRRKVRRMLKLCDTIRSTLEDRLTKVPVSLVYEYLL